MPDNEELDQEGRSWQIVPFRGLGEWLAMVLGIGALSWLWGRVPKALDVFRKLAINVVVLVPISLIGLTIWQAVAEDLMIVESFTIPKSLEEQGYTGAIVAQQLIDKVELVTVTAKARVDRVQIGQQSQFASLSSLQVPQSGLTVQTLVSLLRKVLRPPDDRIGGEITIKHVVGGSPSPVYRLSLRFDIDRNTADRLGRPTDSRHLVKEFEGSNLGELIEKAADSIVEKTIPAVLASYLYNEKNWQQLDGLLDQLVESSKPKIRIRALALRGNRLVDQCRIAEALPFFDRAIEENANPKFAMIKYGEALTKAGKVEEAIGVFERADKLRSTAPSVLLYGSWAKALARVNDRPGAYAKLRQADSQADKAGGRDSRIYRIWGDVLRDDKKYDEAKDKYRIAVALDPQDTTAYEKWGLLLLEQQDVAGAIDKFHLAITGNEQALELHYYLAQALLRARDIDGAVKTLRKAAEIAVPADARAWSEAADKLALETDPVAAVSMLDAARNLRPLECPPVASEQPVPRRKSSMPNQARL
jgi:tetratricopeptide (TPR) repeat protein